MSKKEKESKAFFEIFRKPHEQTKQIGFSKQSLGMHQQHTGDNRKREHLGWIKNTIGGEAFQSGAEKVKNTFLNKVTIKQETLILGALCAVFLSLACFFTGYKIGHNKASNFEMGVVKSIPPGKDIKAINLSTNPPYLKNKKEQNITDLRNKEEQNITEKWTLQIIVYSNTKQHMKNAANLAKAIKNMTGYNTFVAKRGKDIVVCVGRFHSSNNAEIKKALNEISNIKYEGKKQFASAYPIQIR
jgi:hypothetical protein